MFSDIAKLFESFEQKFKIFPDLTAYKHLLDLLLRHQQGIHRSGKAQ
jgi:hypothetical protein